MDRDRFRRVDELYNAALRRDVSERSGFLREACAGDEDLRHEVESLLAYDSKAIQFMERPAVEVAASMVGADSAQEEPAGLTEYVLGTRLSHYRIMEKLGSGGMGVVYRAQDQRLGRDVAIKVLSPGSLQDVNLRKRLRKEAMALSRVNHPNVAVIHDFDTHGSVDFIVMELIPGITLTEKIAEGPLAERDVSELGVQLAEGLTAAHDQGVIHRDLKPGNLRLAMDGRLKILDFGLAKSLRPEDPGEALTETNTLHGTLPYMAPEQLLGGNADARSDIYSSGAVLYELATGCKPFPEVQPGRLTNAILKDSPRPPALLNDRISPKLSRIILKCLNKDPQNRYPSASALARDLRALAADSTFTARPTIGRTQITLIALFLVAVLAGIVSLYGVRNLFIRPAKISSLAVLPLDNLSGDPEQEYFADGITDALITNLAKIKALRVVSRTSVMRYKNTRKPLPEIAQELNVDAIVAGAVIRVGDRVRITAQLVRAANDQHLWAEAYERGMKDVLVLQDEVARSIAQQIQVTVTPAEHERLAKARSVDPDVYEAYLKGRYFWGIRTEASIQKAIDLFQRAIEKDPTYAAAYSGMADCYSSLGFSFDVGSIAPREIQPKALTAATRATELDPSSAEARSSLAFIKLNYDWNWSQSEVEFKEAIESNPGWANGHHWYAHNLIAVARVQEAEAESLRALQLDPLSAIMNSHLGWHYYFAHDYDRSLEQLRKTLDLVPNYGLAFWYTGWNYEQQRMYPEALRNLQRAKELLKGNVNVYADIGHLYAVSGEKTAAERVIRELKELAAHKYVNPFEIALIYVGLNEKDQAFEWLERAYQERSDMMVYLNADPRLDPVRSDPRFDPLVRKVGIPRPH